MAENSHGSEQNDALASCCVALFTEESMGSFHVKHTYVYRDTCETCCGNLVE